MKRIPRKIALYHKGFLMFVAAILLLMACEKPDQDIVLRDIRDVVVDATSEPMLKANAIFYNPNNMRGRIRKIDVEIFVNGKKAASVDQSLKTSIPAQAEFTVPLEVKLAIKELGVMDTIFGMIGFFLVQEEATQMSSAHLWGQ